jgi:hypothetical protein
LEEEIKTMAAEGWLPLGEPTLATPVDSARPPYWVQAMYLSEEETSPENPQT